MFRKKVFAAVALVLILGFTGCESGNVRTMKVSNDKKNHEESTVETETTEISLETEEISGTVESNLESREETDFTEADLVSGNGRLSDEFIDQYEPGTNNGPVFSFIGKGKYLTYEEIDCETDTLERDDYFGLFDSQGVIVCDPIYDGVYPEGNVYLTTRTDEYGQVYEGFISIDGNIKVEYLNSRSGILAEHLYLFNTDEGTYEYYDFDGNYLGSSLVIDDIIPEEAYAQYDEKFYKWTDSYFIDVYDTYININTGFSFKRDKSEKVYPYKYGSILVFNNDGTLKVYNDDGLLIEGNYATHALGRNGFYFFGKEDGNFDIYDKDGNLVLETEFKAVYSVADRIYGFDDDYSPKTVTILDLEGNIIGTADVSDYPYVTDIYDRTTDGKYMVFSDYYGGVVVDLDMQVVLEFGEHCYPIEDENGEIYIENYQNGELTRVSTGEVIEYDKEFSVEVITDEYIMINLWTFGCYETTLIDKNGNEVFNYTYESELMLSQDI